MPWSVTTPMSQRREFVEDALRQLYPMRELCARYGISPRVGYKWLARYREQGLAGLADQSRRPHCRRGVSRASSPRSGSTPGGSTRPRARASC